MNQPIDPQLAAVRLPPHSIEAEQSVLGGLLLDNTAWDRIADLIGTDDFYRQDHQYIFGAISRLVDASKPADAVTVFEALRTTVRAFNAIWNLSKGEFPQGENGVLQTSGKQPDGIPDSQNNLAELDVKTAVAAKAE